MNLHYKEQMVIAVYCADHIKHTNTLWGQNRESFNVNASGNYMYHWN
jgi:hypothetical protein